MSHLRESASSAVVCLEGPSAVGKTTLAAALASTSGATVVPELDATGERGSLGFPDLYVFLAASEAQLRARRAGDATRRRRGFETHLRMLVPQRRYFEALLEAAPARVAILDTTDRATLTARVAALAASLPPEPPDAARLLERMIEWVRAHSPDDSV